MTATPGTPPPDAPEGTTGPPVRLEPPSGVATPVGAALFSDETIEAAVHHAAISEPATFDAMIRAALGAPAVRREVEAARLAGFGEGLATGRAGYEAMSKAWSTAAAESARLAAALEAAERRIAAVEAIHRESGFYAGVCGEDGQAWPCPTATALAPERSEAPDV